MSCALCRNEVPWCDWCVARVVERHQTAVALFGRQWGRAMPLRRSIPRWDDEADQERALHAIASLRVADDRARETLARLCVNAASVAMSARLARQGPIPAAPTPVRPPVPEVWLVTRQGQPYTRARAIGAEAFRVEWSRSGSLWAPVVTAGAPLTLPLDVSREMFEHAVGARGVYRLIPIDANDQPVGAPSKAVTLD